MIRVIKPANPELAKHRICDQCKVMMEYYPIDVKKHQHRDYTGDSETVHTVQCPSCGHKNEVGYD